MRLSKVIRATAWGLVAAGVAAPLLRRRLPLPPATVQAVAYGAPLGLSVAVRRSPARDVAVCALQMWAYLAAYKTPHDDEARQAERVHIDYPITGDRLLGLGELPSIRLQRRFAAVQDGEPVWRTHDNVLVWAHWSWFAVPHGTVAYILARHPGRFPRAATLTYTVFNLGAVVYWLAPTAPPWYAAGADERGGRSSGPVRRMMVEYGEHFWKGRWPSLYSVLGGNPLAAMPSLHFATSMMATLLLAESGPVAGALGAVYTGTLGLALVYLGEHYLVDLLAGAALTGIVWRAGPLGAPAMRRVARAVGALEEIAHATA